MKICCITYKIYIYISIIILEYLKEVFPNDNLVKLMMIKFAIWRPGWGGDEYSHTYLKDIFPSLFLLRTLTFIIFLSLYHFQLYIFLLYIMYEGQGGANEYRHTYLKDIFSSLFLLRTLTFIIFLSLYHFQLYIFLPYIFRYIYIYIYNCAFLNIIFIFTLVKCYKIIIRIEISLSTSIYNIWRPKKKPYRFIDILSKNIGIQNIEQKLSIYGCFDMLECFH